MDGTLEPPRRKAASEVKLDPEVSAAGAVRAIVRACAADVEAAAARLQNAPDMEALHQTRVALRRWRTALKLFEPVLNPDALATSEELKWLAGELDEARDLDVFAPRLETSPADELPGFDILRHALSDSRLSAYGRARAALDSERCRRLLWDGVRAVDGGSAGDFGAPSAREIAAEALSDLRRKICKSGGRLQHLGGKARHRLRLKIKRARYASEMCADLFGHPQRRQTFDKALKELQDCLGRLNDIRVARQIAGRLADESGDEQAAFAAGMLASRGDGDAKGLLKSAVKAFERLEDTRPYW